MSEKTLKPEEIQAAAESINVEVAALRAVLHVEALGGGFLPSGRVKILFESHIFSAKTKGRFDKSHPHLSSRKWNRKLYKGGEAEWDRLEEAMSLDRDAAVMSASWGLGQIMGFNYVLCGFESLAQFELAMQESEARQLEAMIGFLKSRNLVDELQRKDWAGFAAGYNGPLFSKNRYDEKLAAAYKKFSK